MSGSLPTSRIAGPGDHGTVVALLGEAFHDDPTWRWILPDPVARPGQLRWLWGELVAGAQRYDGVRLAAGDVAASVWIPPGGTEVSPERATALEAAAAALPAPAAGRLAGAFEAFDAAHPDAEPHWYLSLLGTAVAQRGRGHGLALLAADLERIDAAGMPAYLEASNPANVALYARYGFAQVGSFRLPGGGPAVPTMWRPAAR